MARNLSSAQRKQAVKKVARRRGISESSVTDAMIQSAFDSGSLTWSDCGSSYDSGSSSGGYDSGGGCSD